MFFLSNNVFDIGALDHFFNCMIYSKVPTILLSTELVCPVHKYDNQSKSAYCRAPHE